LKGGPPHSRMYRITPQDHISACVCVWGGGAQVRGA
jgi:hypothetical protein